jgi:negative regulator of sigma E activity
MDLSMEPGVDFVEQINEAVGSCRLLVAVIGPRWASVEDAHGRRRLDDPADFIRVEIESGLRRPEVRVVPVLVQGARMPGADELPSALADLARRNALELSDSRWRYDVDRLASTVERVLGEPARPSEVSKRLDAEEETGAAHGPVEHPPADAWVDDSRTRGVTPSWFGRHSRLAISGAVLAVIVGVAAVILASGGDDGAEPPTQNAPPGSASASEARLLQVIPASVREAGCERAQGKDFWMGTGHHADVQENCELPTSVLSEAIPGGGVTYGLFPSVGEALDFVENDYRYELGHKSMRPRPCSEEATAQLETDYRGGNAECYKNRDGVFINWSYRESAVAAQLYFNPGTRLDAAVAARAKLL